MPDTQPTAAAMEAAARLYWDKINGVEDDDHPGGAVPVIIADIAAALDAYAAESVDGQAYSDAEVVRSYERQLKATEAERDAALAKLAEAEDEWKAWVDIAREYRESSEKAEERVRVLEAAIRQIAKGEGRFSRDHFEHCKNTVEDMKQLAVDALAKAAADPTAERPSPRRRGNGC